MTFDEWWKKDSGWGDSDAGLYELAEYQLAKDAWNAAIDEARRVASNLECEANGYNTCGHNELIAEEIEKLKELK